MSAERPFLDCPNCGKPLIPAHGRGRFDRDGNWRSHRDDCQCAHCDWIWWDMTPAVPCKCGAVARVHVDDDNASAEEIEPAKGEAKP